MPDVAGAGSVAQRPCAESVPRIDRGAPVEQLGGEVDAVGVGGREQRQRDLYRGELGLVGLVFADQLAAPRRIVRREAGMRGADDEQRGQGDAAIQGAFPREGLPDGIAIPLSVARSSAAAKPGRIAAP